MSVFLQSLPFFFTFFSIILLLKWFKSSNRRNSPPSPPKLPIFGNLLQLGKSPHITLRALAQRHGPLMLLHFGSRPVLVVSSADSAGHIVKTHDLTFANRPKSTMFETLLYDNRDVAMAPYGEYWRQMKSVCVLHLLSNRRVRSFRRVREEETRSMIRKIKEEEGFSCGAVNISEMLMTLTNDIICRVGLGRKYCEGEEGRSFKAQFSEFVEFLGVVDIGDYIPWLRWVNRVNGLHAKARKLAKEFDRFLDGVVQEHSGPVKRRNINGNGNGNGSNLGVEDEDHEDFVDVLLSIQKEKSVGFDLDSVSLKAVIMDVLAAGTDTSYSVMEWAMAELFRNPMVMTKLQNELRQMAPNKLEITEDDLDKMIYLKAVIKETLRLHPPLPLLLPRMAAQDVKLNGYNIAAGTQVIINASVIGRDPASWDRAEEFWPERFLNSSSIDFRGHDFQLIPFGSGRRICPGISFAIAINELALANLMHSFDWALPGGAIGQDLDMTETCGITVHRKFPILAVPTPYSPQ